MTACHSSLPAPSASPPGEIALVGHANVGKSALFQRLTGRYVTVSNYPGTTVELSRGLARALADVTIVDTPGIATLPSRSEDERITAHVLLDAPLRAVVQVGDSKSPRRTLSLAVRLAELGLPLVLVCNMADEAAARGVRLDHRRLSELLGIPVLSTVATSGRGVAEVTAALEHPTASPFALRYSDAVEAALERLTPLFSGASVAPRGLALLWLTGDPAALEWAESQLGGEQRAALQGLGAELADPSGSLAAQIERARADTVVRLAAQVVRESSEQRAGAAGRLGQLATHPVWGLPVLAAVLYAFYWFVGVFGAGTLVGLLEEDLFGRIINPWLTGLVPGATIELLQQRPVTVIRIAHTELAVEAEIAGVLLVEPVR